MGRRPWVVGLAALTLLLTAAAAALVLRGSGGVPAGRLATTSPADTFAIPAPLTLLAEPHVVLEHGFVSVSGDKKGTARPEDLLVVALEAGNAVLDVERAALTITEAGAPEAEPASGGSGPVLEGVTATLAKALSAFDFDALTIRDSTITFKSASGTTETLTGFSAVLKSQRKSAIAATGTFELHNKPVSFDSALTVPSNWKKDTPLPFRASITSKLLTASFDGRLTVGDRLQLSSPQADLNILKLRAAARWLGSPWPPGPGLRTFHAKGPFEWAAGAATFENARFEIDGNVAKGSLALRLSDNRPRLEGTLAFDSILLDPYIPASAVAGGLANFTHATSWLPFESRAGDGHPSLITTLDADLRISAASVMAHGTRLGQGAATVSIDGGRLNADLTEIALASGATGEGQLKLDMTSSEPKYALRGKFDDLEMSHASEALFGYPIVQGSGSVAASFAGVGAPGQFILERLTGKIDVEVPASSRLGANVPAMLAAARAKPQEGWESGRGTMAIDGISARFSVADGIFKAESIKAIAGQTRLEASGTINAPSRTLDLTLSVADVLADGVLGRLGKDQTHELQMRGAWSHPSIRSGSKSAEAVKP